MQKMTKRLLSLVLSVMMLVTMMPVSALAAEPAESQRVFDSGTPGGDQPKHWLQEYQGSASPSYRIISWAGGESNRLVFANGAYLGDGMPRITLGGQVAFCGEWNGAFPDGSYVQTGEGNDPVIKQILANYDNSGKSDADYAAAQAAIWAHLMGSSVASWGACPGRASEDEIFNGDCDYTDLKYNYLKWGGGTQNLITYNTETTPDIPEGGDDKYHIEVTTDTSTRTEVRNKKTYEYGDAIGQLTIRKHDQDEKSLDGALFDIDVAFTDGSHTTVEGWEVDNGARLFTWTHPKDNHDPATVTVREVRAPRGYLMDPEPQTAVVAPTYTRVTHVETWTVTIVTETTSSTVIDIESGEVVAESSSSSSAETNSDPQVEEFADFIEGDRETTMTFVNVAMPCSLTIYKHETGNKGVALEGASFRIRYADPSISAQTWTETTDANGEIYIALPYAGSLIVEELSAPAGYVLNAKTTYDVTVAKGEQKILDVPNDKKTQLVVLKKDAQTGQLLAGASIKATLLRSNTPPFEAGQSFTETTGPDGKAVFTNLIPGEYRVEEVSPPQYYQGTTTVHTVNIPEGNSETITVEFRNEPWTGLTIKKVDATDGYGLQNAVFKLYEGTAAENTKYLGDFQTNENGVVTIQKLESGKYYTIVESQPPYGYFLDAEHNTQTVLIKPEAVDGNLTVVFRNMPKPKLLLEKVDAESGIRLPGAVFRVSRRGSSEYVDVTTGSDGTVLLENLEEDWYEVSELRSPTGYAASDAHYDVELIPGKTTTLTVENHRRPGLFLEKIDAETGERLAGAVFRVIRRSGGESVDVTTGANGTVLVDNLEPGWYEVYEFRSPDGYTPDRTHYDIELISGKTTALTVKNSISAQDSSLEFLSSMFFSLMFTVLPNYARKNCPGGRLPVAVNAMLEEACNIGHLVDFKRTIAVCRSFGINCQVVIQGVAQISDRYPDREWEEIIGNCDLQIFLGANDKMTVDYWSAKIGVASITTTTNQTPVQPLFSPVYNNTRPYSQSRTTTQRPLMYPDELLRLDNSREIVILRGQKPLLLSKINPDDLPGFREMPRVRVVDYIPQWRVREEGEKGKAKAVPTAPVEPIPPEPPPSTVEPVPLTDTSTETKPESPLTPPPEPAKTEPPQAVGLLRRYVHTAVTIDDMKRNSVHEE